MRDLAVRVLGFRPAPRLDRELGLLGWAAITVNELLRIDGVVVRRSTNGGTYINYPERRDSTGRSHRTVWFAEPWARREVQRQVLSQLAERAVLDQTVLAP